MTFKFDPVKFSDVCAYAVMSNHYHLVLKVNSTEHWDEKRVLMHWSSLSEIIPLYRRFLNGEHLSKSELDMVYLKTDEYRKRLMSISWFMKFLNEYIARSANIEDNITDFFYDLRPCKSHFGPPIAFKFDPVKFSGTLEKLKQYVKNIKNKIKLDIGLNPALE